MDPIVQAISLAQNIISTAVNGLTDIIRTRGGAFVKAYEARTKAYADRTTVIKQGNAQKPTSE